MIMQGQAHDIASGHLEKCIHCDCLVSGTRMEVHIAKRCPKAPKEILRNRVPKIRLSSPQPRLMGSHIVLTSKGGLRTRCKDCGKLAMPGDDRCYGCR